MSAYIRGLIDSFIYFAIFVLFFFSWSWPVAICFYAGSSQKSVLSWMRVLRPCRRQFRWCWNAFNVILFVFLHLWNSATFDAFPFRLRVLLTENKKKHFRLRRGVFASIRLYIQRHDFSWIKIHTNTVYTYANDSHIKYEWHADIRHFGWLVLLLLLLLLWIDDDGIRFGCRTRYSIHNNNSERDNLFSFFYCWPTIFMNIQNIQNTH